MKKTRKNKKQRRRLIAILIFLFLLIGILWLIFRRKDFTIKYHIDGYTVTENYNKEQNYYLIDLEKEEADYHTILPNVNFFAKKIIYHIEEITEGSETCLQIHSNKSKFSPLCRDENQQISIHLTSDAMKSHFTIETLTPRNEPYEQIHIINTHYHNFYIWNYRGFYHLSDNKNETISLFSKDIYDSKIKLMTQVNNLLWIPNYNSDYFFKEAIVLNSETGKYETWTMPEAIYFDSTILGTIGNDIYLLDKHEKVEWKINPQKKKMEKIGTENKGGMIYQNGWEQTTMNKLMYQENAFSGVIPIDYQMNNSLTQNFLNHSILIRKESPNKLIQKNLSAVYYLVGDTLYSYTDTYGETPLLSYFEWNFNNDNVIFIF